MHICGLDFPEENFSKHVLKRKKEGLIKTAKEYIEKIKETIRNADKFYLIRQLQDCIDKVIFFNSKTKWLLIVIYETNRILTCFYLWKSDTLEEYFQMMDFDTYLREDCKNSSYREVVKDENSEYSGFIKALQDRC
ncbi:hypothetical protein [Persephonella sp.]|uniref:hypothetical protein n=1 Tax=Persephonella sp. TaxID=2060922 RepID=UPI0026010AB4|nr:hypothetical protein [Persephonella sp.]